MEEQINESEQEVFEPFFSQKPTEPAVAITRPVNELFDKMGAGSLDEAQTLAQDPASEWRSRKETGPYAIINIDAQAFTEFSMNSDAEWKEWMFGTHAIIPEGYVLEFYNRGPIMLDTDNPPSYLYYEEGSQPDHSGGVGEGWLVSGDSDVSDMDISYSDLDKLIRKRYKLNSDYNLNIRCTL